MTTSDCPTTPNTSIAPSSTTSSSLYRRHGLSPRQRRLLQAAARARAQAQATDSSALAGHGHHYSQPTASTPSWNAPISPSTSLSTDGAQTHINDTLASSPSFHKFRTHPGPAMTNGSVSGASTAITDATTVSFDDGFRHLRLSPICDINEGEAEAMRGKVGDRVRRFNNTNLGRGVNASTCGRNLGSVEFKMVNDECIDDANENDSREIPSRVNASTCGRNLGSVKFKMVNDECIDDANESDSREMPSRVNASTCGRNLGSVEFKMVNDECIDDANENDSREIPSRVNASTRGRNLGSVKFKMVNDECIDDANENDSREIPSRVNASTCGRNLGSVKFKMVNDECIDDANENDSREIPSRGPLNIQVDDHVSNGQTQRTINLKHLPQCNRGRYRASNSDTAVHKDAPLSPTNRNGRNSNDAGNTNTARRKVTTEQRFYRVVFPGVVPLLNTVDTGQWSATKLTNTNSRDTDSEATAGYHVSYGEILASFHPEIEIPVSSLGECGVDTENSHVLEKIIRVIQVNAILTGGNHDDSTLSRIPSETQNPPPNHGYLMLTDGFARQVAEYIAPSNHGPEESFERGPFAYRVRASSPLRVLSGPHPDAPSMKFALLPGTVHEVSLRVTVPISDPMDEAEDVLVDDADAGEVKFLRLGRRRGWVVDRRVDPIDGDAKRLRVSYLMEDVTSEEGCNYSMEQSSCPSFSHGHDGTFLMNSSVLHLKSAIMTPPAVHAQRRRTNRRRRAAWEPTFPILFQEGRRQGVGESFDTESSTFGNGTVVSTMGESTVESIDRFYLMRALAPSGLKILDAPHFQVSNLIHTPPRDQDTTRIHQLPSGISPFSRTNAMIGSTSENPALSIGGQKIQRFRFLERGQFFEASRRIESTDAANMYTNSRGLIQLADGSGWVIVPTQEDLATQLENVRGGNADWNAMESYEEVGNATIQKISHPSNRRSPPDRILHETLKQVVWMRIVSTHGVKVLLPPSAPAQPNKNHITPTKYVPPGEIKPSSSSHDSEVSSIVSSSFFDSVWSKVTPTKRKETGALYFGNKATPPPTNQRQPDPSTIRTRNSLLGGASLAPPPIPCGIVVPVEYSDPTEPHAVDRCFVRLFNGQGWIPRRIGDTVFAVEVEAPEARFGSFWFRVQSKSGVDVRNGPSSQAQIITVDQGTSFRFECGEFLRASEVVTIFHKPTAPSELPLKRAECFARLYRKNQSPVLDLSGPNVLSRYASIKFCSLPGEWVMVHGAGNLYLEETSTPPVIERNRDGWRYNTVGPIPIRAGPSFRSEFTLKDIGVDQEFLVTEQVTAEGENVTWLRLKDGSGWVNSKTERGETLVHRRLGYPQTVVGQVLTNLNQS